MRIFWIIIFGFITSLVYPGTVDQLEQDLESAKGSERFEILVQLGNYYKKSSAEKARSYLEEALLIASNENNSSDLANIQKMIGLSYFYQGNYPPAMENFRKALALCEQNQDTTQYANVMFNMGMIDRKMGNWEKALEKALVVLEIDQKNGDSTGLAYSYNNLGLIFRSLNDSLQAKDYFLQSIRIGNKVGHQEGIGYTCINLGNIYINEQKFDSATYYFQKSAEIFLNLTDSIEYSRAIYSLGNVCWYRNEISTARNLYENSLAIRIKSQAPSEDVAESLTALGFLASEAENYVVSDSLYQAALHLVDQEENPKQASMINQRLYFNAQKQEQWKKAVEYLDAHYRDQKAQFDLEKLEKFKNLESAYLLEKSEMELNKLKKENELIAENKKLSKILNTATIVSLISVILVIFYVLKVKTVSLRLMNSKNKELKNLNESLDRFVYMASHDLKAPIASSLGLIHLMKNEPSVQKIAEYLQLQEQSLFSLKLFIDDLLNYSRNSRADFRIEKVDLPALNKEILEQLKFEKDMQDIDFSFDLNQNLDFYSDALRIKMILGNLISNAARYKNRFVEKPAVRIKLKVTEELLWGEVEDNGIGIPPEHHNKIFKMFFKSGTNIKSTGLGLFIVKEAIDQLKGKISFTSRLNYGTTFMVEIPNLYKSGLKM